MWTNAEKLISYFEGLDFKTWNIEVNTNTGRFRYKKITESLWYYTAEKIEVKLFIESKIFDS